MAKVMTLENLERRHVSFWVDKQMLHSCYPHNVLKYIIPVSAKKGCVPHELLG